MFHQRLISAFALISLLVAVVWLEYWYPLMGVPGLWIWPLGLYATWATAAELTRLAQTANHRLNRSAIGPSVVNLIRPIAQLELWAGLRWRCRSLCLVCRVCKCSITNPMAKRWRN